jgi:hypothetical protein
MIYGRDSTGLLVVLIETWSGITATDTSTRRCIIPPTHALKGRWTCICFMAKDGSQCQREDGSDAQTDVRLRQN